MKISFDTEFTQLHKDTTLISIALVDENNSYFYAEFNDFDKNQLNTWLKEEVVANLLFADKQNFSKKTPASRKDQNVSIDMKSNRYDITSTLLRWLEGYKTVEFISDCAHYDFVLMIDLLSKKDPSKKEIRTAFDIPKNVVPICFDINQEIMHKQHVTALEAFDISREEFLASRGVKIEGVKHNCLYDARVIKALYEELNKMK